MRKFISIFITVVLVLFLFNGVVNATTNVTAELLADNDNIKAGDNVIVTVKLKDFTPGEAGINVLVAKFNYDKNVFQEVKSEDLSAENGWAGITYNEKEGKFAVVNNNFMAKDHEAIKISLKVKNDARLGATRLTLNQINVSDSVEDIFPKDQSLTLTINSGDQYDSANLSQMTVFDPAQAENDKTSNPLIIGVAIIITVIAVAVIILVVSYMRKNKNKNS